MNQKGKDFDLLFETSWEVCNKVGGIYTVLSTKANTLQQLYKDRVIFIGPDVWTAENPSPFFTEIPQLLGPWRRSAQLPYGITVRVGRWEIPGRPIAVLVGFNGVYAVKNEFYGQMWQNYGVDSLHAYGDYDEACAFGIAAAIVIESIARFKGLDTVPGAVAAHFDEWTTGMGLLYTRQNMPAAGTVFTTHATSIGRSICSNGKPLYDWLHAYNGNQMADELNMQSKHSLEKAAAHAADSFTTVSGITADECAQLLERRPDEITLNGFEPDFVPAGAKALEAARRNARAAMLRVASQLTGKEYPKDTFIVATSGRMEYRNKGLDLYLDSLRTLADSNPQRTVLAFVMVPAWSGQPAMDPSNPVLTHHLHNENEDAVLGHIRRLGFANRQDDRLHVIYVPCYLNGTDGVFDMPYYDLLPGMDATVFCSYYEPWGYTPLESVAFGVPTVTTCLSGFGRWICDNFDNSLPACGVKVVVRTDSNYDRARTEIASILAQLLTNTPAAARRISAAAQRTAAAATWSHFMAPYTEAYRKAAQGARSRCPQ